MNVTVERRITGGATVAIVLLLATGTVALRSWWALVDTGRWLTHTHNVIGDLGSALARIDQVESAERIYILTGQPADLRAYRSARTGLDVDLDRVTSLTADNPEQQLRLSILRPTVRAHFERVDENLARLGPVRIVDAALAAERDWSTIDPIREGLGRMRDVENRLLERRVTASGRTTARAVATLATLGASRVLFLIVACVLLWRHEHSRRLAQGALRASEERVRLIIDNMMTGLVMLTESGRIESMNPAAVRIFGPAMVGRYLRDLIVWRAEPSAAELRTLTESALQRVTEWTGRRDDGDGFPLELSLFAFDAGGKRRFAAHVLDISERHEVDRLKDEFVAVVSHELRTPLTSIRGALQLVLDEKPEFKEPDHEPLLTIALNNCERLIRIINDTLDVAKAEAGQIELKLGACAVDDLARTAIQSVDQTARAAGVVIEVHLEPGLPPITGDFDRVVQILVNLLSNAVKSAPAGSVVTLTGRSVDGAVALAVQDHGAGIARTDLGKLFHKFKQLDSPGPLRARGTGLGLAIVKALAEQHGGHVEVESCVGEGSTFTVTLPAGVNRAAPFQSEGCGVPYMTRSRSTVLIVDDDADVRQIFRACLEHAGYAVIEAEDGPTGIRLAIEQHPDLITMDLTLPGELGLDVIETLSGDARTRAIPIIIISGATEAAMERPPGLTVLRKPVTFECLLTEIARRLERRPATILLADDDDDLRNVLSPALTRRGFIVVPASDGVMARRIYDTAGCDLVVLDLNMPGVDGFEVIRHVRASVAGANLPIVVVSGSSTGGGERQSLELGANIYLAKPIDPQRLAQELTRLLSPAGPSAADRRFGPAWSAASRRSSSIGRRRAMAASIEGASGNPQPWWARSAAHLH
jgi:PAS domain S-box-containing protein